MAPTIFSRKLLLPRLSVVCLAAALSLSGLFVALSDDRTGEEHSDIIHTDCSEGSLDFSAGPENARTGAPGELTCNAALCHNSFLINSGDGAFSLTVPVNFFPSDTIDILVNLSDPGQQRWGFELTALDSADNPLGDLIVAEPTRTQKSTDLLSLRQYLKHTSLGTNLGAQNVAPGWTVRWVSPFGDVGPVTFYAAGNAANGNLLNSGDFIYTTSAIVPIVSEGVRIGVDTTFGMETLSATFSALSLQTVSGWDWDFGDGNTSILESPTHSYQAPGIYSVSLAVETDLGPFSWQVDDLIGVHADSLIPLDTVGLGGAQTTVEVYCRNFLPVSRVTLPLTWSAAPLDLALASASVSGLRSAGMSAALLSINPFARTAVYELVALDSSISPGAGPILSLTFNIGDAAEGTVGQVNVAANSGFSPEFVSPYGVYAPAALSGNVAVFCCDTPGDANNSGSVNIADVTFLVARIFAGGPAPDCLKEGNANGGGSINIADVTFLIARIFAGGPAPICGP